MGDGGGIPPKGIQVLNKTSNYLSIFMKQVSVKITPVKGCVCFVSMWGRLLFSIIGSLFVSAFAFNIF